MCSSSAVTSSAATPRAAKSSTTSPIPAARRSSITGTTAGSTASRSGRSASAVIRVRSSATGVVCRSPPAAVGASRSPSQVRSASSASSASCASSSRGEISGRPPAPTSAFQALRSARARTSSACRSSGGRPGRSSRVASRRTRDRAHQPSSTPWACRYSRVAVAATCSSSCTSKISGRNTSRVSRTPAIVVSVVFQSCTVRAAGSFDSARISSRVAARSSSPPSARRATIDEARATSASLVIRAPYQGSPASPEAHAPTATAPASSSASSCSRSRESRASAAPRIRTRDAGAGCREPSSLMAHWASCTLTPHGARTSWRAATWSRRASRWLRNRFSSLLPSTGSRSAQDSSTPGEPMNPTTSASVPRWSNSERPVRATSEPSPTDSSRRCTSSSSERCWATRSTEFRWPARAATRLAMVCVVPVPGAACTTTSSPRSTASTTPPWAASASRTSRSPAGSGSGSRSAAGSTGMPPAGLRGTTGGQRPDDRVPGEALDGGRGGQLGQVADHRELAVREGAEQQPRRDGEPGQPLAEAAQGGIHRVGVEAAGERGHLREGGGVEVEARPWTGGTARAPG